MIRFALAAALVAALSLPAAAQTLQGKTHLLGKASGMVTLFGTAFPGSTASLDAIAADGTHAPFVMPANSRFVITDVEIRAINPASTGRLRGSIQVPGGTVGVLVWDFQTTQQLSQHIGLTSGVVVSAPPQLAAEAGTVTGLVYLHGYLAADK
jgi:hypothetical protein